MKPCKRDALCRQCAALLAECGDDLFDHYRKKLLIRGWATFKPPVGWAYIRKHRSEAQQAQAIALGARAKRTGVAPKHTATEAESV